MYVILYSSVRNAGVAQPVEQLICNQQVGGSNPSTSSIRGGANVWEYGSVPEWPKGADCKSVVDDFGGSNPPAPTIIAEQKCSAMFFSSDTKGLRAFFSQKMSFIFIDRVSPFFL